MLSLLLMIFVKLEHNGSYLCPLHWCNLHLFHFHLFYSLWLYVCRLQGIYPWAWYLDRGKATIPSALGFGSESTHHETEPDPVCLKWIVVFKVAHVCWATSWNTLIALCALIPWPIVMGCAVWKQLLSFGWPQVENLKWFFKGKTILLGFTLFCFQMDFMLAASGQGQSNQENRFQSDGWRRWRKGNSRMKMGTVPFYRLQHKVKNVLIAVGQDTFLIRI